MKKNILSIAAFAFMTITTFTSCKNSSEKVDKAKANVTEAYTDLEKANKEYQADVEGYRNEASRKVEANNKTIAEFKSRIETQKKEAKADYIKKITELEQKNSDIKKKMDDYKDDGKENWEKFKTEFNHDMEQLGEAFKNLTKDNTK